MIRVTLELVSGNDPSRDRLLGIAHIANTGRGEHGKYTYEVMLSKTLPTKQGVWRQGRVGIQDDRLILDQMQGTVVEFDNVRRGAWDLLYLALKGIVGRRNGG